MEDNEHAVGILDRVKRLGDAGVALVQKRIELFALEFHEQTLRQLSLMIWAAVGVFLGIMALLLVTATIILFTPENARMAVMVSLSVVYTLAAVWVFTEVRRRLNGPPPFRDTLAEFQKDRDWLNPRK